MLQMVASINGFCFAIRKLVASPGNAPGHQGYEPLVESSRLAIWLMFDVSEMVATAGLISLWSIHAVCLRFSSAALRRVAFAPAF